MKKPSPVLAVTVVAALISGLLPGVAAAQTPQKRTATVVSNAPIQAEAADSSPVLRVAASGTVVEVVEEQGRWVLVGFRDPEFGPRVGFVPRALLKFAADSLAPMDLSVPDAPAVNAARPAVAPAGRPAEAGRAGDTMAEGMLEGEMLAENVPTAGKMGVGLGVGALTGLIGTGIGYFVVGPEPLPADVVLRYADKSADYQLGFKAGWEKKSKSKKRNAFLAGGLLGTAAFVVLFVAATSGGDEY